MSCRRGLVVMAAAAAAVDRTRRSAASVQLRRRCAHPVYHRRGAPYPPRLRLALLLPGARPKCRLPRGQSRKAAVDNAAAAVAVAVAAVSAVVAAAAAATVTTVAGGRGGRGVHSSGRNGRGARRVRLELETRRDAEQRNAEREQVYEYLLDNTTLALPERMSEAQVARTIERQRMEMLYRGDDPETVETRLAEMRSQTEDQALNRLKLLFIMDEVARRFEIQVARQLREDALRVQPRQGGSSAGGSGLHSAEVSEAKSTRRRSLADSYGSLSELRASLLPSPPPSPPVALSEASEGRRPVTARLRELDALLSENLVTADEYAAKRSQIIASI